MPSGESLVRQLLHGQRFFERELGVTVPRRLAARLVRLLGGLPPDRPARGREWFLTQKSRWNETNTFPHHTFWWEGIDGTRILTHFPPADTYESKLDGEDVHQSAREFLEKGGSRRALMPFGFGDGGGGPEREMLERRAAAALLEGSPGSQIGTGTAFFDGVREEYAGTRPRGRASSTSSCTAAP